MQLNTIGEMSKLILQPCGNSGAREHYYDTIQNPVPLERIRPFLNQEEFDILSQIYPQRECYIWGVTPGGSNITKWNKVTRGDVTLFSKDGGIFASGVTTFKIRNSALASDLWGYDNKGQTWEYIYFLSEIRNLNIPYIQFNRNVLKKDGTPYEDNYIIQGFSVLDENQCQKFFKNFDIGSEIFINEVPQDEYSRITNILSELESTEEEIKSKRRIEQAFLKSYLFGRNIFGKCACCQKIFPVSFLVTAHIKKRAHCLDEERKDLDIVMPMCKLGCDELFEKGYIYVEEGEFKILDILISTEHLRERLKEIDGKKCAYYSEKTKAYFEWHYRYHTSNLGNLLL